VHKLHNVSNTYWCELAKTTAGHRHRGRCRRYRLSGTELKRDQNFKEKKGFNPIFSQGK
jgi:hypothetical protein